MLLRRITEHIKDQNWFAVGIDFCIVVIGVFFGIQVANWNEARANAAKEKVILAAVLADVEDDLKNLDSAFKSSVLGTRATNELLILAGLQPLADLELPVSNLFLTSADASDFAASETTTEQLWTAIAIRYYPSQAGAALAGLMSAGDLSIISDFELANRLQRYQALWKAVEVSQNTTFRPIRNRLVLVGQEFGLSPFKKIDNDSLADLVVKNATLEGAVRTMQEYGVFHGQGLEGLRDDAKILVSALRDALEEK